MQEIKPFVKSFFLFLRGPIKRIFRAVPIFERIARAIFRRFPAIARFYLLTMSVPLGAHPPGVRSEVQTNELDYAASLTSLALPSLKKRKLSPRANLILLDLKVAVHLVGSVEESHINKGSQ